MHLLSRTNIPAHGVFDLTKLHRASTESSRVKAKGPHQPKKKHEQKSLELLLHCLVSTVLTKHEESIISLPYFLYYSSIFFPLRFYCEEICFFFNLNIGYFCVIWDVLEIMNKYS
jgi:hypothetical protein